MFCMKVWRRWANLRSFGRITIRFPIGRRLVLVTSSIFRISPKTRYLARYPESRWLNLWISRYGPLKTGYPTEFTVSESGILNSQLLQDTALYHIYFFLWPDYLIFWCRCQISICHNPIETYQITYICRLRSWVKTQDCSPCTLRWTRFKRYAEYTFSWLLQFANKETTAQVYQICTFTLDLTCSGHKEYKLSWQDHSVVLS